MADEPMGGGEKTEEATPKKLSKAAEDGDVLQSRELATALSVIMATLIFAVFGQQLVMAVAMVVHDGLVIEQADIINFDLGDRVAHLMRPLAMPFGLFFSFLILAAIASTAMLGSLGWRWKALKPKGSKLNPLSGMKRIFGVQGLVELTKSIAKVGLIGTVGVMIILKYLPDMAQMGLGNAQQGIKEIGWLVILVMVSMALCMAIIALIDVPMQLFQRNKKLRMTKQEVKDEHKETEGSPELKSAIKQRQREVFNRSARKAMKEATVVITNPTHFAVILRYDREKDMAPIILEQGCNDFALMIRKLAAEENVPILEYPVLARALYFTGKAGRFIDERLYMAVATLLAFIHRINEQMEVGVNQPEITVPDELIFDADGNEASK